MLQFVVTLYIVFRGMNPNAVEASLAQDCLDFQFSSSSSVLSEEEPKSSSMAHSWKLTDEGAYLASLKKQNCSTRTYSAN